MSEQCKVVTDGLRCQGNLVPDIDTHITKCDVCGTEVVPEWMQHNERRSAAERGKNGG
jgi:hypothetical protein